MLILKQVLRTLRNRKAFAALFVVNGILGLIGFFTVDAVKRSIEESMLARSRLLLTSDFAVSVRRRFTAEELVALDRVVGDRATERTRTIELYSMIATKKGSKLIELIALDPKYPLQGEITLERGGKIRSDSSPDLLRGSQSAEPIWIDPDLKAQYDLSIGDTVKLGEGSFQISDLILDDTSYAFKGFDIAPVVMMSIPALAKTGLLQKGSTLYERHFFNVRGDVDLKALIKELGAESKLSDPGIRIVPHWEASEQVSRLLDYLNDYMGLISLVTLFLGALGASYLFRSELQKRLSELAIYQAVGATPRFARLALVGELVLLGLISSVFSISLGSAILPFLMKIIENQAKLPIHATITPLSIAIGSFVGVFGSIFMVLPFLVQSGRVKPAALFRDEAALDLPRRKGDLFLYAPVLLIFCALSIWQAHSFKTGLIFFGGLLGSMFLLLWISRKTLTFLSSIEWSNLALKHSILQLSRSPLSTSSSFLAIGIGSMLLNLIPQIQRTIESEIEQPEVSTIPALFLFDIQDEQTAPLSHFLENKGQKLKSLTPLVRARLESLNGKSIARTALVGANEGTREEQEESRFRNRGLNLSYRENLAESEKIVEGRNYSKHYDASAEGVVPEATLERKYAERIGARIGDRLGFEVQGVSVEVKIVGLRHVKWTSFEPNFFVQVQPGVLEDAPKTWLATLGGMKPEIKAKLQSEIVDRFPNVSIIQVSQIVSKLITLFTQMGLAVSAMALLSMISGLFVLFTIVRQQSFSRARDVQLLKTLGADFTWVRALFLFEFAGMATLSAGIGSLASIALNAVIAHELYNKTVLNPGPIPLIGMLGVSLLSIALTRIAVSSTLRERPARLLQSA